MNQQKNIFTNSGIRNKINEGLLQPAYLKTLGYAIGYLLAEEYEMSCPILIATDTRPSGNAMKDSIMQGLLDFGHDVFDAGIAPTPFVAKALKDYEYEQDEDEQNFQDDVDEDDENFFTLGIVITASHNPAAYNGIKILTPFGYLSTEIEEEISEIFHTFLKDSRLVQDSLPDEDDRGIIVDFDLVSWYKSEVIDELNQATFETSILLDCSNGATAQIAPAIFQASGFQVVAINNSLDGTKINHDSGCGNAEKLLAAIKEHKTTWGCAFDGDGDRVIIAHQNGTVFDGDDIVAVLAHHERYASTDIIVGTVMSNQALETYLKTLRKKLIRVAVGERNLIEALIKHQAFLGAESCGHVTMMDHAFCSDGIFATLMFFQTLVNNPKLENKLYEKNPQLHATIAMGNKKIDAEQIKKIVAQCNADATSRIIVRPSNTEPILRIMVEDTNLTTAQKLLETLHEQFKKELK